MKTTRMLTICVLALCLMVCLAKVSEAGPMGTAFTYQGHLMDKNKPADGLYDLRFKLYDVNSGGSQVGGDVNKPDVDVIDAYFTVELDFGSVFDGNAVWLEIGVRPGDLEDPNVYTILEPRLEVTPVPYAIYAASSDWDNLSSIPGGFADGIDDVGGADSDWTISGDDMYSIPSGNVGIGTTEPNAKLTVISLEVGGKAIYGEAPETGMMGSGENYGAYFKAAGWSGRGVYAEASTTGFFASNYGGYFVAKGRTGKGVYGKASGNSGKGVYGEATASGGFPAPLNYGGYFVAQGGSGVGVKGVAPRRGVEGIATGSEGVGIYGEGGSSGYAAKFRGNVIILAHSSGDTVMELGEGLDYAEGFDVSDKSDIAGGTVLVIDSENPGKLAISDKPYDSRVAGIVAGAKGQGSGVRLGADQFDFDVALAGRVYCNVDATEVAVEPGDLLTTSATPGYAMKATDYIRTQGVILGKAMEKLEKGKKGQILVLVTLQ